MRLFVSLMMLICAGSASAQEPPRIEGDTPRGVAFALAQAAHVVQLIRSERKIVMNAVTGFKRLSDLRVSLVVLDDGTSTDLSPRWSLYLAMYNDVNEHGQAWALEPVASAYEFKGASRRAPGIYVAEIMTIDESGGGCGFVPAKVIIDALDLSVAVRQARGLDEFDTRRYSTPIKIETEIGGC